MRRLKVLISAYACEPDKGSEPGVGWNWSKQIARFHDTWVITRWNNRFSIEMELSERPDPNLRFVYYDVPRWLSFWKRRRRGYRVYYLAWQTGVYFLARRLNKKERFDIAHHVTFGNLFFPTFISFLPCAFIWGPLGGGETVQKGFRDGYDLRARTKEFLRDVILKTLKINLLFLYNCKKAKAIIAKTEASADRFPLYSLPKIITTTDVASSSHSRNLNRVTSDYIQLIAVGTLEPWRGFDLLIRAFARIKDQVNDVTVLIIGDGNDEERLKDLCSEERLDGKVIFTGKVSRTRYFELLSKSSLLVNPCLKEGGVTLLFDALSLGLPVICLDVPGASQIVDADCGIKVKPSTPAETVEALSRALMSLITDKGLRERMGRAGKEKVESRFNWEKKGELLSSIYSNVMREFENPSSS